MAENKLTWGKRKALLLKKYWRHWHAAMYVLVLGGYWLAEMHLDPDGPFDIADAIGWFGLKGILDYYAYKQLKK